MRRGFTLIELLVVLAVTSTVLAVAVPAYTRLVHPAGAVSAATQMVELLRSVRSATIARGVRTCVELEPATGRYWLLEDCVASPANSPHSFDFAGDTRIVSNSRRVRFVVEPSGVIAGENLTIVHGEERVSITTDMWAGTINVQK